MTGASELEFVAQTLAWCNERRAEKGKEPLERLPKGRRQNSRSCPCGQAAGVLVGWDDWAEADATWPPPALRGALPVAVKAFVRAFDSGALPQYDAAVTS